MNFKMDGNPDFGDLTVNLEAGESIRAESGAMSRMSPHLQVKGRLIGGFFKAIVRKLCGGESMFIAEYTAEKPGFVSLAPEIPGTVLYKRLNGEAFHLTAGAFLACSPGITMTTKFGGLKAFFSGEGAFFLHCAGTGDLFFNAFGGVVEKQLDGTFTVDTGHLVAWEPTLNYTIGGMGGLKQTLFSGEGLTMKFSGQGKIYLQTRHLAGVAGWLTPYCH